MATDVDVQYFSHLNGLSLGNNWGDLIRLLDKALVTGIDFPKITAASIDAQGDVHITLYAAHNAMLFQVVELSGFAPTSLNQKYRIKGVPSVTELILKPHATITETSIATIGSGKLASLGYDIIFRDLGDVKRVYRAKNPTVQHPFIRVDESLTSPDGTTGVYTSTYAKYAMVGLLEHMEHIDDYENPSVQQVPFEPSNPSKNWKITGTGASVVRGWSRWYWSTSTSTAEPQKDNQNTYAKNREFTLVGDRDAFYLLKSDFHYPGYVQNLKYLNGCGITTSDHDQSWFLMTFLTTKNANTVVYMTQTEGGVPLTLGAEASRFFIQKLGFSISSHAVANPIIPDYRTGFSNLYDGSEIAALEIPFFDNSKYLRGSLKHVYYSGKKHNFAHTQPLISGRSMYVVDSIFLGGVDQIGTLVMYLGELE